MAMGHPTANVSSREHAGMLPVYRRCRAEVSADLLGREDQLIDWLIELTLDTLGGQHVDIRVVPGQSGRLSIAVTEAAAAL